MNGSSLLADYARLAVEVGLNLEPSQDVLVVADIEQAQLAREVARAAYGAGARYVDVQYVDAYVRRVVADLSPEDALGWSRPYRVQQIVELGERRGALVSVTAPADPSVYDGVDGERLARSQPVEERRAYLDLVSEGAVNWTIVAGPTESWARRVFGEPDLERLWGAVAHAVRLDEPDPAAAWRDHMQHLKARADLLTRRGFEAVRLRGPGTDLTLGLLPGGLWECAAATTAWGHPYVPNMPTEEVFTTPHAARTEGVVRSTRPLVLLGQLVTGIELRFEDGRAVEIHADEGSDVLRQHMASDPGALRLGEIALVEESSRVGTSGLTFYDTLFDENASSHIAYGEGLPESLPGGQELGWDERERAGVNHSSVHVDFMVGSAEVDVDGVDAGGATVALMRGGSWVLD